MSADRIYYLQREDIDEERWNDCVHKASNGLIYGISSYLDVMCTNWDALVLNDYEAVMPLAWRKKWNIYYLYQPFFTAALGVFGQHLSTETIAIFINAIPKKFRYWDIHLNEDNPLGRSLLQTTQGYQISERKNFLLDLNFPYQTIRARYKDRAKRRLDFTKENELTIRRNDSPSFIIQQYIRHYSQVHKEVKEPDYKRLEQLCRKINDHVLTYTAFDDKGVNAGFCLLLQDEENIYPILGGSTGAGKEANAFTFLIDAIIKDHAESKETFRFEGSDIPGIAFFNEQFGPKSATYTHIKRNNLPWPLRYLKRE